MRVMMRGAWGIHRLWSNSLAKLRLLWSRVPSVLGLLAIQIVPLEGQDRKKGPKSRTGIYQKLGFGLMVCSGLVGERGERAAGRGVLLYGCGFFEALRYYVWMGWDGCAIVFSCSTLLAGLVFSILGVLAGR
ncbi:hypothetical protein Ancab_004268 [Ancistrocladus abbreviatus]